MGPPPPGTKCKALFDFAGASPEDLPFKKGEIVTIETMSEDPNWWLARDMRGRTGMIPANYVEVAGVERKDTTLPRDKDGNLMPMPWFHGKITRELAEQILQPREDGLYLVRESTNFPGDYTLCVCHQNEVDHYRIQGRDGKITIDEEEFFDSLEELISHYEKDSDGLSTRLTKPMLKRGGKELQLDATEFSRAGYEIPRRELIRGKMIGSGQFGEVYEGTYRGNMVAIKTLKNFDKKLMQSFLSEAHVMTKLEHENLVKLIGVVTQGDPVMLVVEFLSKGNLLDYLRSRGRSVVTPPVQLAFTRDICAAMQFLESKNFVHRDLAARNVLISEDNRAKVADFGLAKDSTFGILDEGKLPIKWTAPEVIKQKVSTSKSDVWSFGITMWEIYSFGRSPYPRMSQKEVVEGVQKGYRMECPDACPKEMYDKVMKPCWEIDPINRPTFKSLQKLLKGFKA